MLRRIAERLDRAMTLRATLARVFQQEDINFLVTNRIPRRWATIFIGWLAKIEQPLVRDVSIGVWRLFSDLDLSEARKTRFTSLHDCFIRELKPGVRPVDRDPQLLTSPCDAIVGACGRLDGARLLQAKGYPYKLDELLSDAEAAAPFRDGVYATLRLTSTMYHRFHAPAAGRVTRVDYISGDTWNVNPIALARVEKLFCRNERAPIRYELASGTAIALVPVAAILVASIRLHFVDVLLHLRHRGPNRIDCDAPLAKGDEMGWFQHGSTIIVLAPAGFALAGGIAEGTTLRMGQPLMRLPASDEATAGAAARTRCRELSTE